MKLFLIVMNLLVQKIIQIPLKTQVISILKMNTEEDTKIVKLQEEENNENYTSIINFNQ